MARRRCSQHSSLLLPPLPLWPAKRICSRCSADSPLTLTPFPCQPLPLVGLDSSSDRKCCSVERKKRNQIINTRQARAVRQAAPLRLSLFPSLLQASLCSAHRAACSHLLLPPQQLPHLYIYILMGKIIDTL